ncbi:hypothetical protein PtB15_1B533 [Puccinia triticina]|nr:hypothetical protein PtB15_1B533 [Puccinia triticina]
MATKVAKVPGSSIIFQPYSTSPQLALFLLNHLPKKASNYQIKLDASAETLILHALEHKWSMMALFFRPPSPTPSLILAGIFSACRAARFRPLCPGSQGHGPSLPTIC